jgi:flagellar biosynthesis protein FlhA
MILAVLSFLMGLGTRRQLRIIREALEQPEEKKEEVRDVSAQIEEYLQVDPLELEIGYGLIPMVDKDKGAELLDRITRIRREAALDLGLVVPRIRIIDNMRLEPSEYCFKIKGVEVGRGVIKMGFYLAINPGGSREEVEGEATRDPAFGLPAKWIAESERDKAERLGYTVVDPPSIIATHLTEIIKAHAGEILGRQEIQSMLDALKGDYPTVVEEVTKAFSVGEIQKVLQGLLREQVSIRNIVAILETMADYGSVSKDSSFLVEKVRQALGRQICLQHADEHKTLRVLTLAPELEQKIVDSRVDTAAGPVIGLAPQLQRRFITSLSNAVHAAQEQGHLPVVLCSEAARPVLKGGTIRELPHLVVLSVPEVVPDVKVESIGEIRIEA